MEPHDEALGATWLAERYQVAGLRARGALSSVYQGQDAVLQRPVAIKAPDPANMAAYRSAMELTATLAHPAFLALYDTVEQAGQLYLAYEFVEGRPLSDYIAAGLPVRRALAIMIQVTRALAYAHSHGVTHGDLTPAAILVDRAATARVANMGAIPDGAYFDDVATSAFASGMADDPDTTAAELSEDLERLDCWASAALLWQLLSDRATGPDARERPRVWRQETPESLRHVIEQAMRLTNPAAIRSVAALEERLSDIERALEAAVDAVDAEAQAEPPVISALRVARELRATEEASAAEQASATGPVEALSSRWRKSGGVSPTEVTDYGEFATGDTADEAVPDPHRTHPADGATAYRPGAQPYQALAPRLILPSRPAGSGSRLAHTLVDSAQRYAPPPPSVRAGSLGGWVWALVSLAVFALCYLTGFLLAPLVPFLKLP